jgi:hypothetical protein
MKRYGEHGAHGAPIEPPTTWALNRATELVATLYSDPCDPGPNLPILTKIAKSS